MKSYYIFHIFAGYGNPYMGAVPQPGPLPQQFNGYYPPQPQMPPQHPNGVPMMGYPTHPQGENGQMYVSSAPPPPTPPLNESTQPAHFTSPPQTRYV